MEKIMTDTQKALAAEMRLALAPLNKRFLYSEDKPIDTWRVMTEDGEIWKGDCDDYAVTALWLLCGASQKDFVKALVSGDAELWYVVTSKGERHMALCWKGMWVCNIYPKPYPTCRFRKKLLRANMIVTGIKLGLGKLFFRP
jgi:hypothetical protein